MSITKPASSTPRCRGGDVDVLRDTGPVVVGVDGSAPALRAVRWAAREAERLGAELRVVHAGGPESGFEWVDDRAALAAAERATAAEAARIAGEEAPSLPVEQVVRSGSPVPLLVEESRGARLLVTGTRGLGGVAGLLVGSVAVGLTARAQCPVVVVREEAATPEGPVLVGVDGSPLSTAALAFAFRAAAARKVPVVAVHAWSDLAFDPSTAAMIDWEAVRREETDLLGEQLAGPVQAHPDVEVRRVVRMDRPARVLVDESAGAQLVVVGSHGRGGLRGLVLGSVGHALLHGAHCPVAVVRPGSPDTGS
jgi:nucleotide-binding universal stress UspA family protein